jgi:hypothetical protein
LMEINRVCISVYILLNEAHTRLWPFIKKSMGWGNPMLGVFPLIITWYIIFVRIGHCCLNKKRLTRPTSPTCDFVWLTIDKVTLSVM